VTKSLGYKFAKKVGLEAAILYGKRHKSLVYKALIW